MSLRRLRRSKGCRLTAGQKSAEGIVGHDVGKATEALRKPKGGAMDRANRERWPKARTRQQNIQLELDFSSTLTGEAREAGKEETESSVATSGPENPASTNRLMEAVCEQENLKTALRQVKANRGSPGVDGMTVAGINDYLEQHWPAIREQLLNRTYEP